MCYDVSMSIQIGVRELRNDVSEVLRRAESGEEFVVTVQGRPVARLTAIEQRPSTMPADVMFGALRRVGVDPAWAGELREALTQTIRDGDDHWPV